jgi:prophage regulatory protein
MANSKTKPLTTELVTEGLLEAASLNAVDLTPRRRRQITGKKAKLPTLDDADERIVDPGELLERIPLDRSTIWRMVQEGRFPPPIQLTASRIGWRWSSILAWLADRERNPVESRSYFGRDKEKTAS